MTKRQREAAFSQKVRELIAGVDALTEKEVRRSLDLLENLRRDVAARIAETDWQAWQLPQLKSAVDRAAESFRLRYQADFSPALDNIWNAGFDLVDAPLAQAGIAVFAPDISRTSLEILQGYSADLIKGVTADLVKRVNTEVAMGLMGGKTPYEVMQAIGKNLDDPGVFRNIAVRAETIARTEMAHVNSAARQARIEGITGRDPKRGWLKKWIHSGKAHARPHHRRLNGVTVPVDQDFPGGLPYPHAPGLPAAEVVCCGCGHVLTLPEWEGAGEPVNYHELAIWD